MGMKIKQNGQWKDIAFPSGKVGTLNLNLPAGRALGDVNGDGKIGTDDCLMIMQAILYEESGGTNGKALEDDIARRAANVHNNAKDQLTEEDAELAANFILNKKENYVGKDVSDEPKWLWNDEEKLYYYIIEMVGMTENFSTVTLLKTANEVNFPKIVCEQNKIKVFAKVIPSTEVQCSIIYTPGGATNSLYFVETLTDKDVEAAIAEKFDALPVTVADDNFTEIKKLRQVTAIDVTREGQDIEIKYTFQGIDKTVTDTIKLDGNGFPISGKSNDVPWTATWTGF